MEGSEDTMRRILSDLQAVSVASPEPGQRVAPTGVMVTDANGLSLGAAPDGDSGHAGAYRHIAKCADVLVMLVEREEEEQQQHLENSHALNSDVHRNPVVFVQTDQRNIILRKTRKDDVAVVVVKKNAEVVEEDESERR